MNKYTKRIRTISMRLAKRVVSEKSEKQKKYQEFFKKKLKEHDVKSPAELDEAEKKKFFDEIDKEWKGEDESD